MELVVRFYYFLFSVPHVLASQYFISSAFPLSRAHFSIFKGQRSPPFPCVTVDALWILFRHQVVLVHTHTRVDIVASALRHDGQHFVAFHAAALRILLL